MIQGGDPTGTGKGGNSISGKKFGDEIREALKVNSQNNFQADICFVLSVYLNFNCS